jgi:hypothetical protein
MTSSRKRPRSEPDPNRAECPFTVTAASDEAKDQKKLKKRKRGQAEDDDVLGKTFTQLSPFSPAGKFIAPSGRPRHETMDLKYSVEPYKKWQEMTRYNSFVRMYTLFFFTYPYPHQPHASSATIANNYCLFGQMKSTERNTLVRDLYMSQTSRR